MSSAGAYPGRMGFVVGALGSQPVRSKGLGRAASGGGREPRGKRHAVEVVTREVACGTLDSLRVFEDRPWAPEGDWCRSCEALVPFTGL
jgi:hypothetical protein